MDNLNAETELNKARKYIDKGKYRLAFKIIAPLLALNNPEAQFLYSTFSHFKEETEKEFERRSLFLLRTAAETGYVPAIYALAVCYETGDLLDRDQQKAAALFKVAADAGYPKARLSHGINLYLGASGIKRDVAEGRRMIMQAISDGVEGAIEELDFLENPIGRDS